MRHLVCMFLLSAGCSGKIDTIADMVGAGSQKDRTAHVKKNILGASADIPLTDLKGKNLKISYDKESGSFIFSVDEFDQNYTTGMALDNARIKDNQQIISTLIGAQQEVLDRRIDAWKEVGNHAIDGAAQAIGLLAKTNPSAASGLVSQLMGTLGPELIPVFTGALKKYMP